MDSDLEAFSHNPTDGSFTALACSANRIYQLSDSGVPLVLT
jgi:Ser/Thr protein kinase RdoA (MazF antagonist)